MAKKNIRILMFGDTHIFYDGSRQKNGLSSLTKKAISPYDYVVRVGDNYDIEYCFHIRINEFLESHDKDEIFKDELHLHPHLKGLLRDAMNEATEQDEELILSCPNTKICSVDGNHDGFRRRIKLQNTLAEKYPNNYIYNPVEIKIGDAYFTHGDLNLRNKKYNHELDIREPLTMTSYAHARQRLELERNVHDLLQLTIFYFWNHKSLLIPRLHNQIEKNGSELAKSSKVRSFGHVHVTPVAGYEYNGVLYNQAGASTYNRRMLPVEMVMEVDENDKSPAPNHLFPNGKVVEIKQVYIEGLTHANKSFVEMLKNQRAVQKFTARAA